MTLRLPLKDLKAMGGDCLVALLQVENDGPILGAAEYDRRSAAKASPITKRAGEPTRSTRCLLEGMARSERRPRGGWGAEIPKTSPLDRAERQR